MSPKSQQRVNAPDEQRLISKAIRAASESCNMTIDACSDKGSYVRARSSPVSLALSTSDLVSTGRGRMAYKLHGKEVCGSISCDTSVPRAHTLFPEVRTSSKPQQGYNFDSTIYVHDDAESESSEPESGLPIRSQSSCPSQGSLYKLLNIHETVDDEDIDMESNASGSDISMGASVAIGASAERHVDHLPVAYAATMAVLAILTKDDLEDLLRAQWKRVQH
ncbi:uncharacterized protein FTOL_10089 [Fusarium torulosum]|uniref:Uncharacterized protein n=1 Tax=Fusarium torulosum TaxID=33205 RepID=A0AAE8SM69_9HYPO|nr:uncharacterized protein FTOL_10089 [Fusarium torulosum]